MFLGQATVYVLGLLHFLPWLRSLRCVFLPYYFVVVNLAAAVGVISCLAGTRITIWTPERVRNSAPRRSGVAIGAITILGFLFAFAYFMLGWAGVYWISFALMAYTYAGYQLLVSTLALFRKRTLRETVCSAVLTNNNSRPHSELPLVSVIIPAYNEESVIRAKLENSLSMDYPAERLEIIVASDGSSDRTVEIAQQFQARHVRLLDFSERRGKAAVLNDAVCASRGSVLCLTDANVLCRRDALLRLVERLQDHSVGAVSAEVRLASEQANYGSGEELYYYLERLVQRSESRLGSMIGLDGGMYVIRREYFEPLRNDTILDDFTTAMQVMRSGKRIVYESRAVASENGTATALEEFRRRVRVSAGSVQLLLRGPLATLAQPVEVWKFVSHKLLRWMSPLWLVTFLVSGIMLWNIALAYRVAGAAQFIFYAISLLAGISVSFRRTKLGGVPFYFTMSHVAIAVGMVLGLLNRQKVTWAKADRGMPTLEHEVAIASSAGLTPVGTHRSTSSSAGPVPAGTHLSASSSAAPVPAGTHLSATSEAH
jgi:cellulose synthase/poly-beta-1,6-N-acetylglucosamine synthase-like glycosyltransferase